jgi:hypothetical protein
MPAKQTLRIQPGTSAGDRIEQRLLGGLHTFGGRRTERMARDVVSVLRTDKLLTATPIKRGRPDAAHPSAGASGGFSYDWRVVDRAFRYMRRVGVQPYISIDATPQLLGGGVAPFTGLALATQRPNKSGFAPQVPNDLRAFGAIVRDLVHHVTIERRSRVAYWSVWNEPDGSSFWKGSMDDYLRLYDVAARAVKAGDRRQRVGGPETAAWSPAWIEALIRHVARTGAPLDFISWHYYSGGLDEFARARVALAELARRHGLRRAPPLVVGEWAWQSANLPGTGLLPFRTTNFFLNDWAAAFAAASLIEMQTHGVRAAIYTNPVAERDGTGYAGSGLMSSRRPWATLNAFRLWSRLSPRIVRSHLDAQPGIFALASRGRGRRSGRVTVLVSRLQYRAGGAVRLHVSMGRRMRVVRHYVIDAHHSNAYDAGARHAALERVRDPQRGRELSVLLPTRSVHLLVLAKE